MKRTYALLMIAAALFAAAHAEAQQPNFDERWETIIRDVADTPSTIPYDKLHAYALKLLRERTVAKDDAALPEKKCWSLTKPPIQVICETETK